MKHYVYVDGRGFVAASASTRDVPEPRPGLKLLEVDRQVKCHPTPAGCRLRASDLTWVDDRTAQQKTADQWAAVRQKRDGLLAASDWVAIKQAEQGGPMPRAWRDYRQALRDITLQADPFNITWPTAPQ